MKTKIKMFALSAFIAGSYLLSKILILFDDHHTFVKIGCIIGIIAAITAAIRFHYIRKAEILALNEVFAIGPYIYLYCNRNEENNHPEFSEIMLTCIICIVVTAYFIEKIRKTKNKNEKIENIASIMFLIGGGCMFIELNAYFMIFSFLGYIFTSVFEIRQKDYIYGVFCILIGILPFFILKL